MRRTISGSIVCGFLAFLPTAAVAQWWNPFAPTDYEECAESAAKSAKTNEALKILISTCASKFAGRRKAGGDVGIGRDDLLSEI
jgi:hypothetical protein